MDVTNKTNNVPFQIYTTSSVTSVSITDIITDTYASNGPVTHTFALGVDTPAVNVTLITGQQNNIAPLTLGAGFTIGVIPLPVTNLAYTESRAGEVDLTWDYNVNLAADFIVTAIFDSCGNPGTPITHVFSPDASSYAFAGLTPDTGYFLSVVAEAPLHDGSIGQSDPVTVDVTAPPVNLDVAGPQTISENGTGTLTLGGQNAADDSQITGWQVTWTDANGQTLADDSIDSPSSTDPYPAAQTDSLTASISAYDLAGAGFSLPAFTVTVTPAAPADLSAAPASPNEIDLTWTNASSFAVEDEILISADGTNFTYFDSVDASQTTYAATGLIPDKAYRFEIKAVDANGDESATPSNAPWATTEVDPWHSSVSGSSTVAEGGTYHLTLSTDQDADAPTFDHWTIDWGDGSITAPDIQNVYTADTTVNHTFASGTASAFIQITASTSTGAISPLTVAARPISIDIIPTAPTNLQATMESSTEVDLSWTSNSLAASGVDILRSLNGGAFGVIDSVDSSTTTYEDTSLDPSDTAQYEVQADGDTDDSDSVPTTSTSLVTTPSGTPSLDATLGPAGSNSVILTWSYQGNDDSGFEIEEYDPTVDENFHTILTTGGVGASGSDTATITGLTGGDSYQFRIRADHTDGSVSDYSDSGATIPIADAPGLSVQTIAGSEPDDPNGLLVSWSGASPGQWVYIQERCDALPGNTWSTVWYGDQGSGAWPTSSDGSGSAYDPGAFGAGDYSYRVSSKDIYGQPTAWSLPQSGSIDGGSGPAPQLSVDGNTITATWPVADGPEALLYEANNVSPLLVGNGASLPNTPYPSLSSDQSTYTSVMSNLIPGTEYDFVLWTPQSTADGGTIETFGNASAKTAGTAPVPAPAGPNNLVATWAATGTDGYYLHWQDDSNNEKSFNILRSINGSAFASVGDTDADQTTFNDQLPDDFLPGEPLAYEVEAVDAPATSQPASTAPSTQPLITPYVFGKKLFQIKFIGPGKPQFFQTVSISGDPVTDALRAAEKKDHGGKDPFDGPVPDNLQGNPNTPMPEQKIPKGWTTQDGPQFPGYPTGFVGTKTFVTTVKDAVGNVLKTIHWHTSIDAKGNITTAIDSQ